MQGKRISFDGERRNKVKKAKGWIDWIDDWYVGYSCECCELLTLEDEKTTKCPNCGRELKLTITILVEEIKKNEN